MDQADCYTLNQASEFIKENLDAKYILDDLISKEVLDTDHDDEIRAETTPKRRTEKLLEILPKTRGDALKHFKGALEKDYKHIVQKLNDVQVPQDFRTGSQPGRGGIFTASSSTARVASNTDTGVTTTTRNNSRSVTTDIRGNNNFVVIGGTRTTINNYRR